MTARTCPACGLQQTLNAPRCARCGAPLDGSVSAPPVRVQAAMEDRTVFRAGLVTPPSGESDGPAWPQPTEGAPGQPEQAGQSGQPGRPMNTWPGNSAPPEPSPGQPGAVETDPSGQVDPQMSPVMDPSGQPGHQPSSDTEPSDPLAPGAAQVAPHGAADSPSGLQRLWRRIIGAPAQPAPPGDAPKE